MEAMSLPGSYVASPRKETSRNRLAAWPTVGRQRLRQIMTSHRCTTHVSQEMTHRAIIISRRVQGGATIKIHRGEYRCSVPGCHYCECSGTKLMDKQRQ